jgi:restriction system protein
MSMDVWCYSENLFPSNSNDRIGQVYVRVRGTTSCVFCGSLLKVLCHDCRQDLIPHYPSEFADSSDYQFTSSTWGHKLSDNEREEELLDEASRSEAPTFERHVSACERCGWWVAFEETLQEIADRVIVRSYGGAGAIKKLDLRDVSTPIDEVRSYLAGRYNDRFEMHPALFEQTVASVFGDLGYRTRSTGQSGDGGIDIILWTPDGTEIGVQVKRYRKTIEVHQIRELTGALVQKGITKGMFVTTSQFTKGGPVSAGLSALRGRPIELVDAASFFERLDIAQRTKGFLPDDQHAPWRREALRHIHQRIRKRRNIFGW